MTMSLAKELICLIDVKNDVVSNQFERRIIEAKLSNESVRGDAQNKDGFWITKPLLVVLTEKRLIRHIAFLLESEIDIDLNEVTGFHVVLHCIWRQRVVLKRLCPYC